MKELLKLSYERCDSNFRVVIVSQDEADRCLPDKSRIDLCDVDGCELCSDWCPEWIGGLDSSLLYIRGKNLALDNTVMHVSSRGIELIAKLVAKHNGRKNVVMIEEAGIIY